LTQEVRASRLRAFDRAELRVLVATNVAARGLDVVGLEAIVNYELPRSTSDYTHRVGRTGRAGRAGVAVSPQAAAASLLVPFHLSPFLSRTFLSLTFLSLRLDYMVTRLTGRRRATQD
jgi:ATP-dependent helicase YprA (DUF1998 family)